MTFHTFFGRDLSLFAEVGLVADEHDDDVGAPLCPDVVDPLGRLVERVGVGDVVHHHRHRRVTNIAGDKRPETLLARRVPKLQPHCPVLQVHCFGQKVDADSCLRENQRGN